MIQLISIILMAMWNLTVVSSAFQTISLQLLRQRVVHMILTTMILTITGIATLTITLARLLIYNATMIQTLKHVKLT